MSDKKKILIIDDDPIYVHTINIWLHDTYDVIMTTSSEQAFEYLSTDLPDLILLDYALPVMPGPQILERLRDDRMTGQIPVMILTGNNDRESIMRILSLEPADYLLKTITKEELISKIEAVL